MAQGIPSCIRQSITIRSREGNSSPLFSTGEAAPEILCPVLSPLYKRHGHFGSNRGLLRWSRGCSISPMRRCRESWDYSTWRRSMGITLNTWRDGANNTESDSLQCCLVPGQETVGTNWKMRFLLNNRRCFCTTWTMKHWHRLSRGIVKSPLLEIFESHLDMILSTVL